MANPIFSGARARFLINGQVVGFCAGVSGEESVDYEPIHTLDFLEIREFVPVGYRAALNAGFFRVFDQPLKSFGEEKLSIYPKFDNILTTGEMQASIDMNSDGKGNYKTIALFTQVKAASKTFEVNARGVVAENVSFVAVRQMDESEINV